MAEENDTRRIATGPWITVGTVLGVIALVAYVVAIQTQAALWAAVVFALSVALDQGVLRKQIPDSRIATELAFYEVVKFGLLIVYGLFECGLLQSQGVARFLSYVALLGALGMTIAMVAASARMIRNAAVGRPSGPRNSIAELLSNKVLGLTALVVAFLHVTYCLTFALAFSDRFGMHHDLYATWDGVWDRPTKIAEPKDAEDAELCATPLTAMDRVRRIFFLESAATLPCTLELRDAAKANKELRAALCENGIESRIDTFRHVAAPSCDAMGASALQRRAAIWNLSELYALRSLFRQMAAENAGCTYLIEIRGHANDTRLKNDPVLAYGSNYEISKQRADHVENLIRKVFDDATQGIEVPPVRWLSYGVSNEPSFIDSRLAGMSDARPLDAKLSVELHIQKVGDSFGDSRLRAARSDRRELELLDYVYFMVYTITTTGYGDITPTSAYAKFVVTLANLTELLFVVVLVNVIANTRPSGKGDEDAPPSA